MYKYKYKNRKKKESVVYQESQWVNGSGSFEFTPVDFCDGEYYYCLIKKDFNGLETIVYDSFDKNDNHKPDEFGDKERVKYRGCALDVRASYTNRPTDDFYKKIHNYVARDIVYFAKDDMGDTIYKSTFYYSDDEESDSFVLYLKFLSAEILSNGYERHKFEVYSDYESDYVCSHPRLNLKTHEIIQGDDENTIEIKYLCLEDSR